MMKHVFRRIKCFFVDCSDEQYRASFEPLCAFTYKKYIVLLGRVGKELRLLGSTDGSAFTFSRSDIAIKTATGESEQIQHCSDFSVAEYENEYVMTYRKKKNSTSLLVTATSRNLLTWIITTQDRVAPAHTVLVSGSANTDTLHAYAGTKALYAGTYDRAWNYTTRPALEPRKGYFDETIAHAHAATRSVHGTLVLFGTKDTEQQIGIALFDKDNPSHWIWRSEEPLWTNTTNAPIVGAVITNDRFYIYTKDAEEGFRVITIPNTVAVVETQTAAERVAALRHDNNPLLVPREELVWESRCVFNPAVILGDDGRIHMLYRAIGEDGVSRIGYAASSDGVRFDERHPTPAFAMDKPRPHASPEKRQFSFALYPSGGSWGGSEDPRLIRLDGKIYLSFNAFDGWDFIRVALTSIDEKDFFEKRWRWDDPKFLSPHGEIHKNWVFFPEKINGKYAILHSITPEVQIEYVDHPNDLSSGKQKIISRFTQTFNPNHWAERVRGAGPPPLKTEKGWLVFYHAHGKDELHRYKLGVLLLDLQNPSKVIARAQAPLLEPDMWYENDWKPGIVYASGAVIKDDKVFIYYGGGDKHVCLATTPLDQLLKELTEHKDITIEKRSLELA